jgi:thymidylate synthase
MEARKMNTLVCENIGDAWLKSCEMIMEKGEAEKDDEKKLRELMHFEVWINNPSEDDMIIEKYGDKEMIRWMLSNFMEQKRVPELKNSLSYGTRLFNYNGKNQVDWVKQKLREKPETKAATITMLMPNEDKGYIPCVSMMDFKLRHGKLILTAMCRSIDFGNKVYANMRALHKVQKMIADTVLVPCGPIVMTIVSAHIYDDDFAKIKRIIDDKVDCKTENKTDNKTNCTTENKIPR